MQWRLGQVVWVQLFEATLSLLLLWKSWTVWAQREEAPGGQRARGRSLPLERENRFGRQTPGNAAFVSQCRKSGISRNQENGIFPLVLSPAEAPLIFQLPVLSPPSQADLCSVLLLLPQSHIACVCQQRPPGGSEAAHHHTLALKRLFTLLGVVFRSSSRCSFVWKTACVYCTWEAVYIVETELLVFDRCFFFFFFFFRIKKWPNNTLLFLFIV